MASFFIAVLALLAASCSSQNEEPHFFGGQIMGTTYQVTVIADGAPLPDDLDGSIRAVLEDIDGKMSTYKPESELSRLNRAPLDEPLGVSPELMDVLALAMDIHLDSEGAFDPSVGPLVDLWGFGPSVHEDRVPSPEEIAGHIASLGFATLELARESLTVTKRKDISIDLSAIAKGYAADKVGELLRARGLTRYMVEVGGEMALSGLNSRGTAWRIAVERPVAGMREVQDVVLISDAGLATSGDYRNYFEKNGKRYSHTIDPRTGYPIDHTLASITVVASSSALADALATALMVKGEEEALRYAQEREIAIMTLSKRDDTFIERFSPAFEPYLKEVE
ncbi:MAG: FAD:protein FMN transferase [Porticoccaceae bacterium]